MFNNRNEILWLKQDQAASDTKDDEQDAELALAVRITAGAVTVGDVAATPAQLRIIRDAITLKSAAVPADGLQYELGDVVWNSAPVPGGVPGWVCTTAGLAGTTAVFNAMAALAA